MTPQEAVVPILAGLTTNTVTKLILAASSGGRAFAIRVIPGLILVAVSAWVAGASDDRAVLPRSTVIWDPVPVPESTWKLPWYEPFSSAWLPNFVVVTIRSSSELSCPNSVWAADCALVSCEPEFDACTARSRMRCRIVSVSLRAPSAVWTTLMPSWALRAATCRPPICDWRPWLMDRPAASSAARLIRRPEDSFSSEPAMPLSVVDRLRYAFIAMMLELMRRLMVLPP